MRNEKKTWKWTGRTAAVIAVIFITVLLAATAFYLINREKPQDEPSLEEVLKEKLTAYETDLRDSLCSINSTDDAAEYLLTWAKNKQITAARDTSGNVIYTVPASQNMEDAEPAAILCSFDASNMDSHVEELAAALTIAKNAVNHGRLKVIFLAWEEGRPTGVQNLNPSLFEEGTEIICLGSAASESVSLITGGYEHIHISKKLEKTEPSYNKAYRITIKNLPSDTIYGQYNAAVNPVKILGSVLANFKSTTLLFELASFSGGSDVNFTPSSASMKVVINDSDTEKFEKKLNNSINKLYEKYKEQYPSLEYTYEETDLPSKVIAEEDTDNLISLMYTSFNGVYNRNNEGTITALTNIGKLSTKDSHLSIDVAVMCSDPSMLQEISETYQTICGLCDVTFTVSETYPVYDGSTSSLELLTAFEDSYLKFTGDGNMVKENTAVLTNCTFIHEADASLPILFCSVTEKSKHKLTGSVLEWLDNTTKDPT